MCQIRAASTFRVQTTSPISRRLPQHSKHLLVPSIVLLTTTRTNKDSGVTSSYYLHFSIQQSRILKTLQCTTQLSQPPITYLLFVMADVTNCPVRGGLTNSEHNEQTPPSSKYSLTITSSNFRFSTCAGSYLLKFVFRSCWDPTFAAIDLYPFECGANIVSVYLGRLVWQRTE